jgi:hypothetical protein
MPRVSGDTSAQVGSAWLASAPPLWLTDTLPDWLIHRSADDAELDQEAFRLRASVSRSTNVLRRLAKGHAA